MVSEIYVNSTSRTETRRLPLPKAYRAESAICLQESASLHLSAGTTSSEQTSGLRPPAGFSSLAGAGTALVSSGT